MNAATDAQNLLDYLHIRHACDITERAGRGTLREKFGWSRERYSNALVYGLDPANGPLFAMTDAASAPLVPMRPPSAAVEPILRQLSDWSLQMARTSRKHRKVSQLSNPVSSLV